MRGFTLLEVLVSLTLGLVLMTFLIGTLFATQQSNRQTQQLVQLQQNSQMLLSLFQSELPNMMFFAGRSLADVASASHQLPPVLGDCVAEFDAGSFPLKDLPYLTLYAEQVQQKKHLNCLNQPKAGSELLQFKRIVGSNVLATQMRTNRFYFETSAASNRFVSSSSAELIPDSLYWPYSHQVFYISEQKHAGDVVPVLMRKRLIRNAAGQAVMDTDSIMDGVERMHFEFGLDANLDGQVDYYLSTVQMQQQHWQQQKHRIINIKFYLLLRSLDQDFSYQNNQLYQMGQQWFKAPSDPFRRLLVSSSVAFSNTRL
ncbi:PilW family protein [Rheinheimera sp. 1928-s]|uniref:PilW family protein n=1 Tax=Rheinheimera sp. 1928-s TaxID=3033803 RepID=UPI002622F856|nr:PilW family protein [Rheinheimera sp. 1928-s]MDF3124458.1 PilW family protein [Rheinheimera sp. 1928-s]